ncbi:thrombomodulin-like [Misgurnus anguillicaudatus]|uniref:thrombomodulin-like n=1 Tax=Misgurnus anguillicaudatus TaxID=75329 RepID=UPI003CCFB97E
MACKDTGQTWKYFTGLTAAILLIHVCVVETIDVPETSKFQFSHTDESQHHIQKRDADVDECVQIPPVCGPNSICNNIAGSYNCSCMSGYKATDLNLPINISNPCTGMIYS